MIVAAIQIGLSGGAGYAFSSATTASTLATTGLTATQAAEKTSQTISTFNTINNITQTTQTVTQAGTTISQAGVQIEGAIQQRRSTEAEAGSTRLDGTLASLNREVDRSLDDLQAILESFRRQTGEASRNIQNLFSTLSSIVGRTGV